MRDAVRNKERCKRRRAPTQDPITDLPAHGMTRPATVVARAARARNAGGRESREGRAAIPLEEKTSKITHL